jgi:hypothetical protein
MTIRILAGAALASLGLLVAGCASSSPERMAERYKERCAARGYQPGTDAFADCLVQLESATDVRREVNRREMMERRPDTALSGR